MKEKKGTMDKRREKKTELINGCNPKSKQNENVEAQFIVPTGEIR